MANSESLWLRVWVRNDGTLRQSRRFLRDVSELALRHEVETESGILPMFAWQGGGRQLDMNMA